MPSPRYRLDLFTPRGGWVTTHLGDDFGGLDKLGYKLLQPSGPALAYRVRRARKQDLRLLEEGVYQPSDKEEGTWRRVV